MLVLNFKRWKKLSDSRLFQLLMIQFYINVYAVSFCIILNLMMKYFFYNLYVKCVFKILLFSPFFCFPDIFTTLFLSKGDVQENTERLQIYILINEYD